MAKTGRPIKGEQPRDIKLSLRISKAEGKRIKECADAMKSAKVDAVIAGIELLREKLGL